MTCMFVKKNVYAHVRITTQGISGRELQLIHNENMFVHEHAFIVYDHTQCTF